MGKLYAKQPNGNFCKLSSVVDAFTVINMSKEELIEMLTETNYDMFGYRIKYEREDTLKKLDEEIENPSTDGRYLTTFEHCLEEIMMSNYTIDELRNELKEMGYEQWETFEPIDYMEEKARENFMLENFDKYIDILKQHIISEYNNIYFKTTYLHSKGKNIEEFRNDINNIKTIEDYQKFNIIYDDFESLSYLVEDCQEINQHIDYKKVHEKFKKQLI